MTDETADEIADILEALETIIDKTPNSKLKRTLEDFIADRWPYAL